MYPGMRVDAPQPTIISFVAGGRDDGEFSDATRALMYSWQT